MNAVNAVQLYLLVWSFSAVCQGDKDVSGVSCDDVTGTVGKEMNFTCRVPEQSTECCVKLYKFQYPDIYNDSKVYRQEFYSGVCEKRTIFTYRYTPDKAMRETFRFFLQSTCGQKTAKFTVKIAVLTTSASPYMEEMDKNVGAPDTSKGQDREYMLAVILAVGSCFIIIFIVVFFKIRKRCEENSSTWLYNVLLL